MSVSVFSFLAGTALGLPALTESGPTVLTICLFIGLSLTVFAFGVGDYGIIRLLSKLQSHKFESVKTKSSHSIVSDALFIGVHAILINLLAFLCLTFPSHYVSWMWVLAGINMVWLGGKIGQFTDLESTLLTSIQTPENVKLREHVVLFRKTMLNWLRLNGLFLASLGLMLSVLNDIQFQAFCISASLLRSVVDIIWCKELYAAVLKGEV